MLLSQRVATVCYDASQFGHPYTKPVKLDSTGTELVKLLLDSLRAVNIFRDVIAAEAMPLRVLLDRSRYTSAVAALRVDGTVPLRTLLDKSRTL